MDESNKTTVPCTLQVPNHSLSKKAASKLRAQETETGRNNSKEEEEDEKDEIPEVVFNQMLAHTVSFVGVPMASGIGLLSAFVCWGPNGLGHRTALCHQRSSLK